jgi:tetratricopeptide (TPR) repeat protein
MSESKHQHSDSRAPIDNVKGFWEKYSRTIVMVSGAIIILAGGYLSYVNFYKNPNEEKAREELFRAEMNFRKDSLSLALKGDASTPGFLKVISKYGGTASGNIAHLYAGECYLHLGDFKNAVSQLEDFDDNGARQLGAKAKGLLGDAYSELKQNDKAVSAYRKAASLFEEDPAMSSEYLFRAALLLEIGGKTTEAGEAYAELRKKFPRTEKGFLAEKHLARLGITED